MDRFVVFCIAIPIVFFLSNPFEANVVAEFTYNPQVMEASDVHYEDTNNFLIMEVNAEEVVDEDVVEQVQVVVNVDTLEVETVVIEDTAVKKNDEEHTGMLTARKGYITDSPCGGSETWYPDAPVEAVKMMENLYGFKDLKMTVREKDGVRILSGTMPNGETFEGLVVVAADIRDVNDKFVRNIDGIFERGDIVETSLGTGIVVDYCQRAVNERKANGHIHIGIATNWS